MNLQHAAVQRIRSISGLRLDAAGRRPRVWAAMLAGAGLGLGWGIVVRIWMRLIATAPSFTIEGTAAILIISTLFGMLTGLSFTARRRGWRGWRHYLPRTLAIIFFLPFGMAGGFPMMLTVLLATLGRCQRAAIGLWVAAGLAWLAAANPDVTIPAHTEAIVLALAAALTAWKLASWRWRGGPRVQRIDRWIERLGRGVPLLLSLGIFWLVAEAVMDDKPGPAGVAYIILYLLLVYTLHLALRISVAPRSAPSHS